MAVEDAPFRVVADHTRAAAMLIADGVIPSNEGRGYVLRRIIRRALRYGRRLDLGTAKPFLETLVAPVLSTFEGIHFATARDLAAASRTACATLAEEEVRFSKTMSVGADRVGEAISVARREGQTTLSGAAAFRLYDTHGVPLELIEEISSDEGVQVDRAGFEKELSAARERSKGASKFEGLSQLPDSKFETEFRGYPEQDFVSLQCAKVQEILRMVGSVPTPGEQVLRQGDQGWVVADKTVFYPEGGGQVHDEGRLVWPNGQAVVAEVKKNASGAILHFVVIEKGQLKVGDTVTMSVDEWTRRKTQANHTGTHLLHAALRQVLGESVRQMGSLVALS